jgi:hypothetical protein
VKKILLKAMVAGLVLLISGYANISSALPIERSTYDFSATCYDCEVSGVGSKPSENEWKKLGGSIILSSYILGDKITNMNFVSFTYDGVSKHLDPFTIGHGDSYDFGLLEVSGNLFADSSIVLNIKSKSNELQPSPPILSEILDPRRVDAYSKEIYEYSIFIDEAKNNANDAEAHLTDCRIALIYEPRGNPCHEYLAEIDKQNGLVIDYEEDKADRENLKTYYISSMMEKYNTELDFYHKILYEVNSELFINIDSDGSWVFSSFNQKPVQFGERFVALDLPKVPAIVTEPTTLTILALGLMGLGSRRFRKQAYVVELTQ